MRRYANDRFDNHTMPALTVTYNVNVCSNVKPLERNFQQMVSVRQDGIYGWMVGCSGGSHRNICVVSNTTTSKTRMSRSENKKKNIHYSVAAAYYKYSQNKSSSHEFLFFIYKVLTPTSSSSLLSIFLIVDTMDVTYIEITRMPCR